MSVIVRIAEDTLEKSRVMLRSEIPCRMNNRRADQLHH